MFMSCPEFFNFRRSHKNKDFWSLPVGVVNVCIFFLNEIPISQSI